MNVLPSVSGSCDAGFGCGAADGECSSTGERNPVLDRELGVTDTTEIADGWVYGVLEYRHDIFDLRMLFMLLMAHVGKHRLPNSPYPFGKPKF